MTGVVVDPSLAGVPESSKLAGLGDLYGDLGIIGGTVDGGYAEKCLAPSSHVYKVPDSMPLEHAAHIPDLLSHRGPRSVRGRRVTGRRNRDDPRRRFGVSTAAIQLAKHAGAIVLATAGTDEKCDRALELGADHACNNRSGDVTGSPEESLLVPVSTWSLIMLARLCSASLCLGSASAGDSSTCGNSSGDEATIPSLGYLFHAGIKILGSDPYRPEEFAPVWDTFCQGDFEVVIDSEFVLVDAADAQAKMLSNDFFGKIILRP